MQRTRPRTSRRAIAPIAGWCAALSLLAAATAPAEEPAPLHPDDVAIVDCLLPGQLRQLGRKASYLSARRPTRAAAYDCTRLGGEFVAFDRATHETALRVWLPRAEAGDAEAANQVGEIFERGLGTAPDPAQAAVWYQRAAEAGSYRAQVNLAHLYERGQGVEKDLEKALHWYRRAAALPDAILIDSEELARSESQREQLRSQRDEVRKELQRAEKALERALERIEELERGAQTSAAAGDAEVELAAARREVEALRQRVERHRLRAEELEASPVVGAPPEISLIDPPLGLTRAAEPFGPRFPIDPVTTRQAIVGRVTAAAGLASLSVNDVRTETNDVDIFEVEIPISEDLVPVEIVAVDAAGKRAVRRFALVKAGPDGPSPPAPPKVAKRDSFGRYHALVIGNDDYQHVPTLRTAVADARSVADVLRSRYGFRVELLLNADRRQVLAALNGFRERLTTEDNFVLYYAGHGEIDSVNRRGYWLPVDAQADDPTNWISNVFVTDTLNVMQAKQAMVVVDACYSGALTRSGISRLDEDMPDAERDHWLEVISRMRARTVLASGGLKPVSDARYAGGRHSVFATALLEVLRANEGVLEGQRLYREVAARVAYATERLTLRQIPEYAPIRHAGHEAGDFLMVPELASSR